MATMKVQHIRFGPAIWDLIRIAASDQGVSASHFIRDAALARAIVQLTARPGGPPARLKLAHALTNVLEGDPECRDALHEAIESQHPYDPITTQTSEDGIPRPA